MYPTFSLNISITSENHDGPQIEDLITEIPHRISQLIISVSSFQFITTVRWRSNCFKALYYRLFFVSCLLQLKKICWLAVLKSRKIAKNIYLEK